MEKALNLLRLATERTVMTCSYCGVYFGDDVKKCDLCQTLKRRNAYSGKQWRLRTQRKCIECLSEGTISSTRDTILSCCSSVKYCSQNCMTRHLTRHQTCGSSGLPTLLEIAGQIQKHKIDNMVVLCENEPESCRDFSEIFLEENTSKLDEFSEMHYILIRGFSPSALVYGNDAIIQGHHGARFAHAAIYVFTIYLNSDNKMSSRINAFDSFVSDIKKISKIFKDNSCLICFETVKQNRDNNLSICCVCERSFHWQCILSWWKEKRSCPFCCSTIRDVRRVNDVYYFAETRETNLNS